MWVSRLTAAASGPASDLEAKMGPFVDLLQDCVEAVKVLYASIDEANAVDAQGSVTADSPVECAAAVVATVAAVLSQSLNGAGFLVRMMKSSGTGSSLIDLHHRAVEYAVSLGMEVHVLGQGCD